jgi:FlaA1/EpsC-like NDP-sugar epimerase
MTKAVGEKLVLNANKYGKTKFLVIRGGNVLGSAGSAVPLFIDQIKQKNAITVTNSNMTRYFMTLGEAIDLLITASECPILPAEMVVMRMPSCTIGNLAKAVIKLYGNETTTIIEVGMRAGEKMHELLLSEHESMQAYCFGKDYYIVSKEHINLPPVPFAFYSSDTQELMKEDEIINMLKRGGF